MRLVNRVAAALLGVALVGLGLLSIVEAALVAVGASPWLVPLDQWHSSLSARTLADNSVLGVSIIVGVVGLTILILELRPCPPRRLVTGDPAGPWWVARRSLERRAAAAAGEVMGVHNASARARGRERHWRLRLRAEARPEQRGEVIDAVRRELDRLAVPSDIPVKVALRRPRRVA